MMITGAIATGEDGTVTTGGTATTAGTTGDPLSIITLTTAGVRQAIITGVVITTTTVIQLLQQLLQWLSITCQQLLRD